MVFNLEIETLQMRNLILEINPIKGKRRNCDFRLYRNSKFMQIQTIQHRNK